MVVNGTDSILVVVVNVRLYVAVEVLVAEVVEVKNGLEVVLLKNSKVYVNLNK